MQSRLHLSFLLVVLGLSVELRGEPGTGLSKEERREFRELATAALVAATPAERADAARDLQGFSEKADFAELCELLRAGPLVPEDPAHAGEELVRFGSVWTGFRFKSGDLTLGYAVDVPPGYDSDEPRGLLLDPGHGSGAQSDAEGKAGFLGMYRRLADEAGHRDWLVVRTEILEQVGDGGLRGKLPEERVVPIFDDFLRDLMGRYAIDPDRIYATGVSQTGFWTWYLGRARADRFAGLAPMAAVTWQVDDYLANFLALPVYALHGSVDATCSVEQPRATCAALQRLGAPTSYREFAGAGHDYATFKNLPVALEELGERARERYPRRLSKSFATLSEPWCYWVRVDALERESSGGARDEPTAGIDAEIDGQTIRIFSSGVEALTLALADEMLDLDRDVDVVWNGRVVHSGPVARDFAATLAVATEKTDWSALFAATLELD